MTTTSLAPARLRSAATDGSPLTWPGAVALHLAPGLALLTVHLCAAPALREAGLPPLWGLLAGIALVLVPLEFGLVRRSLRFRGLPVSARALGLRRPVRTDLAALTLAAAAALLLPAAVLPLEPWIATNLLGRLPDWYGAGVADLAGYSSAVQAVTLLLYLVVTVVLGPVAEELYFRGWLLPRLPGGTVPASLAGAALFAVYHLWQPQAVLTVFLFALPLSVLVRSRGNVALSVALHCGINLLTFAGLLAGVLQR